VNPSVAYSHLNPFDATRSHPFDLRARAIWISPFVLHLDFMLKSDLREIILPEPIENPGRTDNLWEHTCFEGFIALENSPEYLEVNLSSSGQWNIYEFRNYRTGRVEADQVSTKTTILKAKTNFNIQTEINLSDVSWIKNSKKNIDLQIGLTAVIELKDKVKSYCALTHKSDKPDFHIKESFILKLKNPAAVS
jgi:hypothetical protein